MNLINRYLNRIPRKNKVFCIGLHKTGTTTLAHLFSKFGFRSIHSTDWVSDKDKLERYDFFSDGGSHFDNINEFDFEKLFNTYGKSKFILQTRDTEKWILSKLKHAGWNKNTKIEGNEPSEITHNDWTRKSLLTVQKLIEHKYNYEKKVISFFNENDKSRIIVIDVTNRDTQASEYKRLVEFLDLKSVYKISLPHSNKQSQQISIPADVREFIRGVVKSLDGN